MMKRYTPVDTLAEARGHRCGLLLTPDQLLRKLVQMIEFLLTKHVADISRQRFRKRFCRASRIHEDKRLASGSEHIRHQARHVVFSNLDFLNSLISKVDETVEIDPLLEGNGSPFARNVFGFEPSREFLGILDRCAQGKYLRPWIHLA